MPVDPYQIALAGLAGFASAGFLRWWQYRRDIWISEIERFTDTLEESVKNSTEYWLKPVLSEANDKYNSEDAFEAKLREVNLLGLQARLDGFYECFIDRITFENRIIITDKLNSLSFALTGGDFQSSSRDADYERAQLVQANASDLLIAVRMAVAQSLGIWGTTQISVEKFLIGLYNLFIMKHNKRRSIRRR